MSTIRERDGEWRESTVPGLGWVRTDPGEQGITPDGAVADRRALLAALDALIETAEGLAHIGAQSRATLENAIVAARNLAGAPALRGLPPRARGARVMAVRLAVEQRSPAWHALRRKLVTATDLPIILGLNPYRCEADLAAEKRGEAPEVELSLRMRIGSALEPMIAQEYSRQTGRRLRRYHGMVRHPSIEWAAASPDYGVIGERLEVEIKWSGSRSRFADGLPQDVEAQVAWQLGCMGYPAADVAVLVGDDFRVFRQEHDEATFAGLVDIAEDFRRRLADGGPFAENAESLKRHYPNDNGAELVADDEIAAVVTSLVALRSRRTALEADEERLETAIKTRMGEFAVLAGPGFRVTWKRTKDVSTTDWRSLADGLLRQLPETERAALVGLATTVRAGFRPLRVVAGKEDA